MKKNTNKGITLIALVITIIVMLILVAVTISMAVNGGLFEYARNAGTKTNAAKDAEQEYANLGPDMAVNQLIDKYTQWTEEESTICKDCTDGYIISYICGESDCGVVSNGCKVLNYMCKVCGQELEGTGDASDIPECPTHGDMKIVVSKVQLNKCSHISNSMPEQSRTPCPNCTITFYYHGNEYAAIKGKKWKEIFDMYSIFSGKDDYVKQEYVYVCYEDGSRVQQEDIILDEYTYTSGLEFTIEIVSGQLTHYMETWYAYKGQTWEDWVANMPSNEWEISDGNVWSKGKVSRIYLSDGTPVSASSKIIPGYSYVQKFIPAGD